MPRKPKSEGDSEIAVVETAFTVEEDEAADMTGRILDADGEPLTNLYYLDGLPRTDMPDGVYLEMPDGVYFAQERLGSSDGKTLAGDSPEDWWYGSRYNPDVEDTESEEDLLTGRGVHCRVLEGETAFDAKFIKSPHKSYQSKVAKTWRAAQIASGVTPVKEKTYRNILMLSDILRHHPQMGPYLAGGLSEVTVLFTIGGIKWRARFDKLLLEEIIDLKSMGKHKQSTASIDYLNKHGMSRDVHTCLRIIRDMRYALQRYLYSAARLQLRQFVMNHRAEAPLVWDATPNRMEYLQKVAAVENWRFVFLFIRKISHTTKNPSAPVVQPIVCQPGDFFDDRGYKMFEQAMLNYEALVERFGLNTPWGRVNQAVIADDAVLVEMFGESKDPAALDADDDGQWDDDDEPAESPEEG